MPSQTKLRAHLITGPSIPGQPTPTQELPVVQLDADGDEAKRQAAEYLEGQGYSVRTINWTPQAGTGPALLAYIERKESK